MKNKRKYFKGYINRIIAAALSVAALTVSAQKKVDFSVRAYLDIGNKEPSQDPAEYDKPDYKHGYLGCFELNAGVEF